MVQILEKFEQNYLNCFTSKVISYFRSLNIPFELLLYRAYEDSSVAFDQFILAKKKRWQCKNNILQQEDLELLDIFSVQRDEVDYQLLRVIIEQETNKKNMVFVTCDVFYLLHRKEEYRQKHNSHWVILTENGKKDSVNRYSVFDDNSNGKGDFVEHNYHEVAFRDAYENNILKSYRFYNIQTNRTTINHYSSSFLDLACKYFTESSFSLYYYDHIPELLLDNCSNRQDLNELLDQVIEGLAYLSGSRYLFQLFLKFVDRLHETQALLQKISEEFDTLKLILIKYKVTNKFNSLEIKERFQQIKEHEAIALRHITSYFKTLR